MNDYIYIGKVVGTHGIKGEIKIISDEILIDKIFKKGNTLYFGSSYQKEIILSNRVHKNNNLVTLKDYEDINLIDDFLNKEVYIKKSELELNDNEYLLTELIDCDIKEANNIYGKVKGVEKGKNCIYLRIKYDKDYLIPLIDEYIVGVNTDIKTIYTRNVTNLII